MVFESFAHVPVTEELLRHVWEGEPNGRQGGHRSGLGREGKTEFPEHWDISMVEHSIHEVLSRPQRIHTDGRNLTLHRIIGGVMVCVKLRKSIHSYLVFAAFPVCGDGVFRVTKGIPRPIPLDFSMLEA